MLKRGTQVIYVPTHAKGNVNHPDSERGFVTSVKAEQGIAFCRYWSNHTPGLLRTQANSEATPIENLVEQNSVLQGIVDQLLGGLP